MSTKIKMWVGVSKSDGMLIEAEIENGVIRGFYGYVQTYSDQIGNSDCNYLQCWCWAHEVELCGGVKMKTGDKAPKKPHKFNKTTQKFIDEAVTGDLSSCDECGMYWDLEDYSRERDWIVSECAVYCKECAPVEATMKELEQPEDIFKSPDGTGMDTPRGFKEVEELFCDSSGMGSSYEPAMTKNATIERIEELMRKHKRLYSRLTGIGQFQVYVTLYKKTRGAK